MAVIKFLARIAGITTGVSTVEQSAGAADASKIPNTNAAGILDPTLLNATTTSAGAASANKVVQLGAGGLLDLTMMPTGVAADVKSLVASEALAAGNFVNVYYDGTATAIRMRKADQATGRPADGYVVAAVAMSATGVCYFDGVNNQLAGLSPGVDYWLGTAGAPTATPPSTGISQRIGKAVSATELPFFREEPVTL
jgi:hypothetical protein